MTRPTYVTAPLSGPDAMVSARLAAQAVNSAISGKLNVLKDITLTASATSTSLTDARLGAYSIILFMPTTANAATAMSSIYVSSLGKGVATINHASSANADQTFTICILG